jgi:thiol-disulfide isomerase/thioredoxin
MRRRAFLAGLGASFANAGLARAEAPARPAAEIAIPCAPPRSALALAIADAEGLPVGMQAWSGRLVALNLWSPWCLPCRREMPSLSRLKTRLGEGPVAVLPLAFDWRGAAPVREFYREAGIANLPVYLGSGENLYSVLGLSRLPTTAIIDASGACIAVVAGEASWDDDATLAWLGRLAA